MAQDLAEYNWASFNSSTISQEKIDHISEVMGAYFRSKTKAEIYEKAIRYNITTAPMQNIADLTRDPQLIARRYFVQIEHTELREAITYPGAPLKIREAPWKISRQAPLIGEHNDEIYRSELGFSANEIIVMKQSGII
jgi:crotonobetainyl-CoA:carnitine CoA-transferase CaiB-like acyl-CoA transferase